MNEIFRITGIAIVGGIMAVTVRSYNATFGTVVALAVGVAVLMSVYQPILSVVDEVKQIIRAGGLNNTYIEVVMKVTGISYITQFGADMLRDSGESAIASKCELAGKIFILCLTMPVISDFLGICLKVAQVAV